jgi:hypothetical protein
MGGMTMAHIERRQIQLRSPSGRVKLVTRYRVRHRDRNGANHCETKNRLIDAERRKAEIEHELATDKWRDPRRARSGSATGPSSGYPPGTTCGQPRMTA